MKTKKIIRRPEGPENDHAYNPITLDGKCVECLKPKDVHNVYNEPQHTPTSYLDRTMTAQDIVDAIRRKSLDRDFIITAVNAHEAMRDALQQAYDLLASKESLSAEAVEVWGHIEQAIAKAEGK